MNIIVKEHAVDRLLNTNRMTFHPVYGRRVDQINAGSDRKEKAEELIKEILLNNDIFRIKGGVGTFLVDGVVFAMQIKQDIILVRTVLGCAEAYFWEKGVITGERYGRRCKITIKKLTPVNLCIAK